MNTKEIKFIYDFNLAKMQRLKNRLTIGDIKKCNLHPAIFSYIDASIEQEIFLDRKRILENSKFNYRSDRITDYLLLISGEIKRSQHFDLNHIKELLHDAIQFNAKFLGEPNNSLVNLIYADEENRSIEEIVISLSHVYYYRYLKKILLTFFDKKKVLSLRKTEFISLLNRIDKISKEMHLENTISTAVSSMANFFDSKNLTFPINTLELYLEEKILHEYLSKLKKHYEGDSSAIISATEALSVLKSVTPEGELIIENPIEDEIFEEETISTSEDYNLDEKNSENVIENNNQDFLEEPPNESEISEIKDTKDDEIPLENKQLEVELKKKPDAKKITRELIDLDNVYNTINPPSKPFSDETSSKIKEDELKINFDNELEYQIDKSTINEEIELQPDSKKQLESDDHQIDNNRFTEEKVENDINSLNNEMDISLTIDEVVSEDKNQKDQIVDEDNYLLEEKNHEKTSDNKNTLLTEDDTEEITEVFTDLTYLDENNEQDSFNDMVTLENDVMEDEVISDEHIEEENEAAEINVEEKSFTSFGELTSTKDMSKILESIFDYDMEDYHTIIQKVSDSESEDNAIKIINEYLEINNINHNSKDSKYFRALVSEYFTKEYS